MLYLILLIIVIIMLKLYESHLIINFRSFFKKGFKLNNDNYGLYAFCGKQGSGKTLSSLMFLEEIRCSRKVITNVKSYYDNHRDYCIYNDNFFDIIEKFKSGYYDSNYIIFYDELFTILDKGKLNKKILTFISQLRKRELYLITTVQEWLDINVTFRRYVRYQVDCKIFNILNRAFSLNFINDGYEIKWDNLQNEYVAPLLATTFKKCSKEIADSYDTLETIDDVVELPFCNTKGSSRKELL